MKLEASKSESNRALIISALEGNNSKLTYLSNARDTETMQALLSSDSDILDVKDAGTTMRFLTAFLAVTGNGQVLTGTDRMKKRPIGPLVDALRTIGAEIEYVEEDGYPPLKIHRITQQKSDHIKIPGNISSQYISALMMIAPYLSRGLTIELTTEIFSRPYLELTINLMKSFGVDVEFVKNNLYIAPQTYSSTSHAIEGDWSGASYWYSFVALSSKKSSLVLPRIRSYSSQGDRVISDIMFNMGVASHYEFGKVKIIRRDERECNLTIDFRNCPDLAQTVMAAAAVTGVSLNMTGLESLKIKETDRIAAMRNELAKIGAVLTERGNQWELKPSDQLPESIEIDTYEDHRMAMAFAPLSQVMDVIIDDPAVVNKSYPGFWEEVDRLGVGIDQID